jgi:hypothetical protein
VDGGWFFPGPLDVEQLKSALSLALQSFPHAAGRLRFDDSSNRWNIALTNSAIPLTVHSTTVDPRPEVEFMQEYHPDWVDRLSLNFSPLHDDDEPLVRLKLTHWLPTNEWSLSTSWAHVLGTRLCLSSK